MLAMGLVGLMVPQACSSGDGTVEGLCEPGENIFCRCPGGDPGTKACNEDGESFAECGPCMARPTTGPGQQSSSSTGSPPSSTTTTTTGGGGMGAGGSMGEGGGGTGTTALLQSCDSDGDCISGLCRFNYCTVACTKVSDCPYPQSECVSFDANLTICMPSCDEASDCTAYTAPPSRCGFTQAIDNWDVTVCAEWADQHQLKPPGVDCLPFDHTACNLGYLGRETVCTEQGVCAQGCYTNPDCPQGQTCSSQGSLGNCQ